MTHDAQRRRRLADMGIVSWHQRRSCLDSCGQVAAQDQPLPAATVLPDLETLRAEVQDCTRCDLHQTRTQTVFGTGSSRARLLIVGEAPGADEDAQGEPFVGRAGQLLNSMLAAIGLRRQDVYIANILKCRPPGNRDPKPHEVGSCSAYLDRQIALVAPQLILAIGRVAAQNLLGVSTPIGKMRGCEFRHSGSALPVIVTYHPAYLLRSPREKRKSWEDLKRVSQALAM